VAAAMLEEAQGNLQKVFDLIKRAFKKLSKSNVQISRDQWFEEAIKAEKKESLICCKAIVQANMMHGLDELLVPQDEVQRQKAIRRIWLENAKTCFDQDGKESARCVYQSATD
jgi:hypothetical protein